MGSAEHSYRAKYAELQRRSPWRPDLTQAQIDEVLAAGCPDDQRRRLYRTTIEGEVPFQAGSQAAPAPT